MRERVWRKLLCFTLAFALVIGMMPAIPGAVNVAHADTTITEVSVTGITVPEIGKTPAYTASVPDSAAYYIGTDIEGVNFDNNGISWVKRGANNSLVEISSTVAFEEGVSYDVRMEIYANNGYTFDAKENMNITINGKEAYVISGNTSKLFIRYTFPPLEQESIDSVALTMEGYELSGLVRKLSFDSDDHITVGSDYGTDKNYVVFLGNTTNHLTFETAEFFAWQQYYVGYYLEAKPGYGLSKLTSNTVTLNGEAAYSLTTQDDGRILAIFALEKLGYIHEIELEVPLPVASQPITKPVVVSVDGDPNLKHLVTTESSQWSTSSFFVDGAKYEKVDSGNFQDGMAYKLELEACPADVNNYYLADNCTVTVKTSDGQILQRGQIWFQDFQQYKQTNYFNLKAPTAYDTLKNWDIEISGYNGGASLMNLSAKVTANGKNLMLPAGETFMIYEANFAEPEPPYLIKYNTQYILTMPLLTVDMDWPGVDWVIDDINNVKITLYGQPLSISDLMNMDGNWWVMYKLPILKEGTTCNGLTHDYESVVNPATFDLHGESYQKCKGCGLETGSSAIPKVSTVQLTQTEYTYNGKSQCPGVIVKDSTGIALKEGQDYNLMKPADSSAAGTYTITVILKGNYSGSKDLSFKINAAAGGSTSSTPETTPTPEKATIGKVKLSTASYVYNGKVKSPKVIVKDSKGNILKKNVAYTVTTPKGRKDIGKYTYTIKFKGDFAGTKAKKLTLTIKPKTPTIIAPKAAKKAVTVKWKKGKKAQVTGYQVMVATNSKFTKNVKTVNIKGYKATSKKVSKLKATAKYFVKVRTYKTVKGVKIYSDWSKVKSVKTK